jgi:integrase
MERIKRESAAEDDAPRSTLPASGLWADEKLSETLTLFLASKAPKNVHRTIIPTIMRNIGKDRVGELTINWIETFIKDMGGQLTYRNAPYAPSTIKKYLGCIKTALKWRAKRLRLPQHEFCVTEDLFPDDWEVQRERRLEQFEERLLVQRFASLEDRQAGRFWALLLKVALDTGARQQELILAKWTEFSLTHWTIPALHIKGKKKLRDRVVPLTDTAREALAELATMRSPGSPRVFHVWRNPGVVSTLFHRWVVEAGIEDFRFHDLRHEGISRMVLHQRQLSVWTIMLIVGHKSPEMIERYTNLRGDELAAKLVSTKDIYALMEKEPDIRPCRHSPGGAFLAHQIKMQTASVVDGLALARPNYAPAAAAAPIRIGIAPPAMSPFEVKPFALNPIRWSYGAPRPVIEMDSAPAPIQPLSIGLRTSLRL